MYYVVHDWMVSDLHLKGLEKEMFAIIYGFSQDYDSEFNGSIPYISSLTSASEKGIRKALNGLLEKNLIRRYRKDVFSPFRYSVEQSSIPCGTKYRTRVEQSTGHIYINNNNIKNSNLYRDKETEDTNVSSTKKRFSPPSFDEVSEYNKEAKLYASRDTILDYIDFYESKNWMVGKNKMSNWKSAFNRWVRSNRKEKADDDRFKDVL